MYFKASLLMIFILFGCDVISQTFLKSYQVYRFNEIESDRTLDSLRIHTDNGSTLSKKEIRKNKRLRKELVQKQVAQFDAVFKTYFSRTGFDFNTCDSFNLIYQTGIEDGLSDYMFWTNKDTISYGEYWEPVLHSSKKLIKYKPFLDVTERPQGVKVVHDRDSLVWLADKKDVETAIRLAKENPVLDGATTTILFAKRIDVKYLISEFHLPAFGFISISKIE